MPGDHLGQLLVIGVVLLLQVSDAVLLGGMVGSALWLKRRRAVLKELLLPAVEDRRLQSHFVAQIRDRRLLQQMPSQNGYFLFGRVVLALFFHVFLPLS